MLPSYDLIIFFFFLALENLKKLHPPPPLSARGGGGGHLPQKVKLTCFYTFFSQGGLGPPRPPPPPPPLDPPLKTHALLQSTPSRQNPREGNCPFVNDRKCLRVVILLNVVITMHIIRLSLDQRKNHVECPSVIGPWYKQNCALKNLQNACAKDTESPKITEMYVQLWSTYEY